MKLLAEKMAQAYHELQRKYNYSPVAWEDLPETEKQLRLRMMEEFRSSLCYIETLRKTVLIQPEDSALNDFDKILGDCGPGPQELKGYIKMSDGYGPVYICIWNPKLNPDQKIPEE